MLTMTVLEDRHETGRLHFDPERLATSTRLNATVIDITPRLSADRSRVENFIREVYLKHYSAHIEIKYPFLMSVRNTEGKILAATGFRCASQEPLFLEHYTGESIETVLSAVYKRSIGRPEIVEIGNLASSGSGGSVFLFAALSAYLNSRSSRFAAITGTDALRQRFVTLGLNPKILCPATEDALPPSERKCWGSYYDESPQVLAGSITDSVAHLQRVLGAVYEDRRCGLYARLHPKSTT
jgi:hypothetical protein